MIAFLTQLPLSVAMQEVHRSHNVLSQMAGGRGTFGHPNEPMPFIVTGNIETLINLDLLMFLTIGDVPFSLQYAAWSRVRRANSKRHTLPLGSVQLGMVEQPDGSIRIES